MHARAVLRLKFPANVHNFISVKPNSFFMRMASSETLPVPANLHDSKRPSLQNGEPELSIRYADIGINLSDQVFRGKRHGKQAHPDDLNSVITRARAANVAKMMITGSDLTESHNAIALAESYPGLCYATVGVHPCSAKTFEKHPGGGDKLLQDLKELATEGKEKGYVTAFGEVGLDYDRLQLCDAETQKKWFAKQLDLAVELQMPLFLHSRAASEDFEAMLRVRLDRLPMRGVVHSFTGTMAEMKALVDMGFDIGINGCSMKTEENLEVVNEVPLDKLQIETDGPWCEMRPSHASAKFLKDAPSLPKAVKKEKWNKEFMLKGRNEPCAITQVAYAIAGVKGIPVDEGMAEFNTNVRPWRIANMTLAV